MSFDTMEEWKKREDNKNTKTSTTLALNVTFV